MLPKINTTQNYEQSQQQIISQQRDKEWDQRHHIGAKIPDTENNKQLDKYIQDYQKNKETLNNSILLAAGKLYSQKLSFSPIKNRKGNQLTPFSMKNYKSSQDKVNTLPNNLESDTFKNKSDQNFYSYVKKNQQQEELSKELQNNINNLFKENKFEAFHIELFKYFVQEQSIQDMIDILKREIKLIELKQSSYQQVIQTITDREKTLRSLFDAVEQIDGSSSWDNDPKVLQIFQKAYQLREYTIEVIQKIQQWRTSLIDISQRHSSQIQIDPIELTFFYLEENYLLKLYSDSQFLSKSHLSNKIPLSQKYDPFLIYPYKLIVEQQDQKNSVFISSFDLSEDLKTRILLVEKILIKEIIYQNQNREEMSFIQELVQQSQASQKKNEINLKRTESKFKGINSNIFLRQNKQISKDNLQNQSFSQRLNKSENKYNFNDEVDHNKSFSNLASKVSKSNDFQQNYEKIIIIIRIFIKKGVSIKDGNNKSVATIFDKQRGKSELRRFTKDFITVNNDMTELIKKKRDTKLYETSPIEKSSNQKEVDTYEVKVKLDRDCCNQIQEIKDKGYYTKALPNNEPGYMKLPVSNEFIALRKTDFQNSLKQWLNSEYQSSKKNKQNTKSPQQEQTSFKKIIKFFTLKDELKQQSEYITNNSPNNQQQSESTHNIIVLGQIENELIQSRNIHKNQSQNFQNEDNQQKTTPIKLQTFNKSQIQTNLINKQNHINIQKVQLNKDEKPNSENILNKKLRIKINKNKSLLQIEEENKNQSNENKIQSQNILTDDILSKQKEEEQFSDIQSVTSLFDNKRNKTLQLLSKQSQYSPIRQKNSQKLNNSDKKINSSITLDNKQQNQSLSQSQQSFKKVGSFQYIKSKPPGGYTDYNGFYKSLQSKQIKSNQEKNESDKMFQSLLQNMQTGQQEEQSYSEASYRRSPTTERQSDKKKSSLKKLTLMQMKQKQEESRASLEAYKKQQEYERQLKNDQEYNDFMRRQQENKLSNISYEELEDAFKNINQNPYNTSAFKVNIQVVPKCLKEDEVNDIINEYFNQIHPFFSGLFMRDDFTLIYQLKNDLNFNFLQAIDRETLQVLGIFIVHPYFDYGQQKGPFDYFDDTTPFENIYNPYSEEENILKEGTEGDEQNNLLLQSNISQQNARGSFLSNKSSFRAPNKSFNKIKNYSRKIMIIDYFSCVDVNMFKGLFSLFTEYIWTHDTADSMEIKLYTIPQISKMQERIEYMIASSNFQLTKSFQNDTQRVFQSNRDEEKYPLDEELINDGQQGKSDELLYFNSFIMISKQEIPENRIFNKTLFVDNGQRFNFVCALSHLFKDMYISEVLQQLANENQDLKIQQIYKLAHIMRQSIRKKKIFTDLFLNQEFDNIEKMNIAIESMSLLPTCEFDDNPNNKIYMNTFSLKLNIPHACHCIINNQEDQKVLYIKISNDLKQIDSSMASTSNSTPLINSVVYSKESYLPMIQIQTIDTKYTLFFLEAEDFLKTENKDLYLYIHDFFKNQAFKETTYKTVWLPQFQINFPHIRNDDFDSILSKNRVFSSLNFSFKLPDYIGGKLLYSDPTSQKSLFIKPPFIFGVIDNLFDIYMPNQPLFTCLIDENDVLYHNEEKTNQCLLLIDKEIIDDPIQGYPKITGIQNNIERSNEQKSQTSLLYDNQKQKVINIQNRKKSSMKNII